MKKIMRRIGFCFFLALIVWTWGLIGDRGTLRRELIRLHVVAASDSAHDQALKLQVRDAVIGSLQEEIKNMTDVEAAKAYLQENLPKIEAVANRALAQAGCEDTVTVKLCVEEFSKRVYDTFTLPAGVYQSLRIIIGEGQGKNWWCVVFPEFCLPAASEGIGDAATCAGFSEALTAALERGSGYEIRFFVLDVLGKLENLLYRV